MHETRNDLMKLFPVDWLRGKNPGVNNPYKMFNGGDSNVLKLIVKTGGIAPFILENLPAMGFMNHIKRKIKYKIDHEQLQHDAPNIFVIRGTTSAWSSYHDVSESLSDFIEIRNMISEFLKENYCPHLSGIIWFNENFNHSKLILNPNVSQSSKLTQEDLDSLGFTVHRNHEYSVYGSSYLNIGESYELG